MSEKVPAIRQPLRLHRAPQVQAFASSLVVTTGALLAAFLFLSALLISLPMMLAASLTLQPKRRVRRGWQELELAKA